MILLLFPARRIFTNDKYLFYDITFVVEKCAISSRFAFLSVAVHNGLKGFLYHICHYLWKSEGFTLLALTLPHSFSIGFHKKQFITEKGA